MQCGVVLVSCNPTNPHSAAWCSTGVHSAAAVESGPALRYLQYWNQQPANVAHIHNQANSGSAERQGSVYICFMHTSQISLFEVSSISTFRMSEIVMESQTGHRPHTLELCLICIKFRIFSIYISLSIYLSVYLSSLSPPYHRSTILKCWNIPWKQKSKQSVCATENFCRVSPSLQFYSREVWKYIIKLHCTLASLRDM